MVGVLILALVVAQGLMYLQQKAEQANEDDLTTDVEVDDTAGPRIDWPREAPQEPVFTDELGQERLGYFQDHAGNWGEAVDALAEQGVLSPAAHGPMEAGAEGGWKLLPGMNFKVLSGQGVAALTRGEDAAALLVDMFSTADPERNASALVQLAMWLDPITEDPESNEIPRKRLEMLRKEADFTNLPTTIDITRVVFYSPDDRPLNLGVIPSEVMDRIVFRECLFSNVSFKSAGTLRLRFERCLFGPRSHFQSTETAPLDVSFTDSTLQGVTFMVDAGQILAANCLVIRPHFFLKEEVWTRSSLMTSVVTDAQLGVQTGPRPEQSLFYYEPANLMSESLLTVPAATLTRLERAKALEPAGVQEIKKRAAQAN